MQCPICQREFEDENVLKKHVEECRALEQIKKEMEIDFRLDSSGCLF